MHAIDRGLRPGRLPHRATAGGTPPVTTARLIRTAARAPCPPGGRPRRPGAVHLRPAAQPRHAPPRPAGAAPDHVALTFDDGPDPLSTPFFLRAAGRAAGARHVLPARHARRAAPPAWSARSPPPGTRSPSTAGCHRPLLLRGPRATYDDLARARDTVADDHRAPPRAVPPPVRRDVHRRPPGGPPARPHPGAVDLLGRGLDGPAPPRSPSTARSPPTWTAAAPSCSTTPTAPPPRAPGARRSAPCHGSSTPARSAGCRSARCASTDGARPRAEGRRPRPCARRGRAPGGRRSAAVTSTRQSAVVVGSGRGRRPPTFRGQGGYGLVGLTERVTAAGGRLESGPSGAWRRRVTAGIPVGSGPPTPWRRGC